MTGRKLNFCTLPTLRNVPVVMALHYLIAASVILWGGAPATGRSHPTSEKDHALFQLRLFCLVALVGCAQLETPVSAPAQPTPAQPTRLAPEPGDRSGVPIIFDTDLGYDADDAGALAVLHALADQGEAEILATVTVVGDPQSAGALDVINTYYGRPDIPVGAYRGERWAEAHPYWLEPDTGYLEMLVEDFESDVKDKTQAEGAVSLYRKVLAAQDDGSVTVVTVGFLQNLADLLRSSPDRHSRLNGRDLIAQKVKNLVVMGGYYPPELELTSFNLSDGPDRDGRTAQRVIDTWPTEIVFSGSEIGSSIKAGSVLGESLPENPVARAYDLYPGTNDHGERASWDLTAVLYAVRPDAGLWRVRRDRHLEVFPGGSVTWHPGAVSPGRAFLVEKVAPERIEDILDALLARAPHLQ